MDRARNSKNRWHAPLAWAATVAMLAGSVALRSRMDKREETQRHMPPATTETSVNLNTSLPNTPTTVERTTTTLPEAFRRPMPLAGGISRNRERQLFDNARATGVGCSANDPGFPKLMELRLPINLGNDADLRNQLSPVDSVVFLGELASPPLPGFVELLGGVAVGRYNGGLLLFTFDVRPANIRSFNIVAEGMLVRPLSQEQLRTPEGEFYDSGSMTFRARINPSAQSSRQLELSIACS